MTNKNFRNINIRLTEDEAALIETVQQALESQEELSDMHVSQRTVVVRALRHYMQYLATKNQNTTSAAIGGKKPS